MMNKLTSILLLLAVVGGGIYFLPKVKTTETVQYKEIIKRDCGHCDVTLLNNKTYHGSIGGVNREEKTIEVESFGLCFLVVLTWAIIIAYGILQILVWGADRYVFDTDFFIAWWDYSHRPMSEEYKQAFRSFFGHS